MQIHMLIFFVCTGLSLSLERSDCASISSRFLAMVQTPAVSDGVSYTLTKSNGVLSSDTAFQALKMDMTSPLVHNIDMMDQEATSPQKSVYSQRKRKQPTESNKMGRVGLCFSPILSNIRKTQSVHDLVHEGDKSLNNGCAVKLRPQTQTAAEKEQKANHRRTLPATLGKVEYGQLGAFQGKDMKPSKGRSYMSPTTSSIAKITRSVSMGENLNIGNAHEPSEGKSNLEPEGGNLPIPLESEKNRQLLKENVVKPVLQPVANCLPKTFQAKNRAHLTLDIGKSLPDRPLLSFGRNRGSFEVESPKSPAGSWKTRLSFPDQTYRSSVQDFAGFENHSPLEDSGYKKCSEEEDILLSRLCEPQERVNLDAENLKPFQRVRSSTIGHTSDYHSGLYPVEPIRPRSPSLSAASALDSGLPASLHREQRFLDKKHLIGHQRGKQRCGVESIEENFTWCWTSGPISFEQCEMIASELQDSLRKAMCLYRSVTTAAPSTNLDRNKIAGLLIETFGIVKRELDSLKDGESQSVIVEKLSPQVTEVTTETSEVPVDEGSSVTSGGRRLGDDKTLALLQQYSELLLQAVEKRMDKKL
ncbi:Hypothetical predicted protein [Pelobates cultripes]|uniref:Uncharacterized protein n=1 Tax=Pelobates cultripes TaxID=61616 RepID=A0AAD1TPR9_PELCU|nr:Hypothetical predicted protein [Pelobates cultripes]